VKHILSNYGEIGRIYLVAAEDDRKKKHRPGKEHHKHRAHRFTEGWVEFLDKRVARSTAELLNARTIGDVALSKTSKKNGGTKKWKDDVWTMKYLPRFKWNMLSEQVGELSLLFG
jgi:ESF2/ABP1 family protein